MHRNRVAGSWASVIESRQSANAQKDKQALKPSDVVLVDNKKACSWFPPIAGITNEARVVDIVNHELVALRSLQGSLLVVVRTAESHYTVLNFCVCVCMCVCVFLNSLLEIMFAQKQDGPPPTRQPECLLQ